MSNPTHMDNGATVDLTEGRVKVIANDIEVRANAMRAVIRSLIDVVEKRRWIKPSFWPAWCSCCRATRGECSPDECSAEKAVREAKAVLGE